MFGFGCLHRGARHPRINETCPSRGEPPGQQSGGESWVTVGGQADGRGQSPRGSESRALCQRRPACQTCALEQVPLLGGSWMSRTLSSCERESPVQLSNVVIPRFGEKHTSWFILEAGSLALGTELGYNAAEPLSDCGSGLLTLHLSRGDAAAQMQNCQRSSAHGRRPGHRGPQLQRGVRQHLLCT